MTSRDRPAPENAAPGAAPGGSPSPGVHSALLAAGLTASTWEQWYRSASVAQRGQLLDQARQQGLLFAHQLPPAEGGIDPTSCASRVAELLAGRARPDAVTVDPVEPVDSALDDGQRQAVARALSTPDVALIQGYPGSGKSRVVAEVLRQAARRSWRALLVAPEGPAVDRTLERLGNEPALAVLRWQSDQEPATSACSARMTLTSRLRSLHEQALPAARRAAQEAWQQVERLREAMSLWPRLDSLLAEWDALAQDQELATAERAGLEAALDAEVRGLAEYREATRQTDADLAAVEAGIRERLDEAEHLAAERKRLDAERAQLAPLAEAKQGQRWWTGAFWRATISGSPQPRLEEVATRCQQVCDRLDALAAEQPQLEAHRRDLQQQREARHQEFLAAHRGRRLEEMDGRLAGLGGRREQLLARWREARSRQEASLPAQPDRTALDAARSRSGAELTQAESRAVQARAWLSALEQSLPGLPTQLLTEARVIASPLSSLPREAFPGRSLPEFDLVVVEDAHRISDADLAALAGRGRRVVLVGEVAPDLPIAPPPKRADRPRPVLPTPPFVRLWYALHPDPRRLRASCRQAHGRLVLTLRPLSPEQHASLQREALFDRPDVEVGIVCSAGEAPCVAEVTFPGSASITEAKQYVYGELQELALTATSTSPRWREGDSAIRLELSCGGEGEMAIALERGVCERVGRRECDGEETWQTAALEFDRAEGWDRAAAERWVEEKLGLRDTGRTAVLSRSYRARPALARFLSRLLYNGTYAPAGDVGPVDDESAVRFVPVPAARPEGRREPEPRRNGGAVTALAPRMRTARGGAGLEVDLVDPRRPDALPLELRPHLPARGVVNYLEAVAVVQALEELAGDPDFCSAAAEWQGQASGCLAVGCCEASRPPRGAPAVLVLTAFPAQAELIRLLARRSPALAGCPFGYEVGLPRELARRECLAALVGLTRSHATRAVPFSDHPRDLLLALTRPAGRLVVFGDPGTMGRRSQWFGALDHLDETTGPLEQALLAQLLAHMPEQEATARAGRTLERSGV
ncbi:MAG: AAA domain-containing protein [Gemmataceae bacterium]